MNPTLRQQLTEQLKTAMRAQDSITLDALRYLLSLVKNTEIDAHHELSDAEFVAVVMSEVKKRNEAISQFAAAGQHETVNVEQQKLQVLMKFLPAQLSPPEVEAEVQKIIDAAADKSFPAVMKAAAAALKGKTDGRFVADTVKKLLAV